MLPGQRWRKGRGERKRAGERVGERDRERENRERNPGESDKASQNNRKG